jgi:hypothetical protein
MKLPGWLDPNAPKDPDSPAPTFRERFDQAKKAVVEGSATAMDAIRAATPSKEEIELSLEKAKDRAEAARDTVRHGVEGVLEKALEKVRDKSPEPSPPPASPAARPVDPESPETPPGP